jgi:oxygen-independent coproporphyrinogen-3 oxidase
MELSLYVHYPFCLRKCPYCAFNSAADSGIAEHDYVSALCREMELRAGVIGEEVAGLTLYFGGGTPSLLDPVSVGRLIDAAEEIFSLRSGAEITLECNPGTVTRERLNGFRSVGVNRLSLGVQSFDDLMLQRLGRIHTAGQAMEAYRAARDAGFENLGIDLIHSLPDQTPAQWERELVRASALEPEHLSVYALTIEEGTPFSRQETAGTLNLPEEDAAVRMFELSSEVLCSRGYEQYEIANFARPGFRSRHNQGYWERRSYLGFGAGAHSFLRKPDYGVRFANEADPREYLRLLASGSRPDAGMRRLSPEEAMSECLFLGLRKTEGVSMEEFRKEFGVSFDEAYGPSCTDLFDDGFLEFRHGFLRLSPKARILSNQVFLRFL